MKKDSQSESSTVLLNQYRNDGFLDFYYSDDFELVMKILNRIMKE